MKIRLSSHALERLRERGIERKVLNDAIQFPDKLEVSRAKSSRFLIKKVYYHEILKKDHLLIVICEKEKDTVTVITVIDTSKISKYF